MFAVISAFVQKHDAYSVPGFAISASGGEIFQRDGPEISRVEVKPGLNVVPNRHRPRLGDLNLIGGDRSVPVAFNDNWFLKDAIPKRSVHSPAGDHF